jgi:5-methylcytosine-specific restriction endonuclease McrA
MTKSATRTGAKTPKIRARRAQEIASRRYHGWRCFYCHQPFGNELPYTFDHYVPYSLWRTSWLRNLVLACEPCNTAKADALPITFAWLLLAAMARLDRNDWEVAA